MLIELYNTLYTNLVNLASVAGVGEEDLKKYFIPEGNPSSESILFMLSSSLQNSGMMRNSIKFNDKNSGENRKIIRKVLFDFNTRTSASTYNNWKSIYSAMIAAGIVDNGIGQKKETNWEKYCRGLYDGIQFLFYGNGEELIRELVAASNNLEINREMLDGIRNFQNEIHGIGFALTCDWLKECGCTWLAKPDVHIKGVVSYVKKEEKIKDADVINYMFSWAKKVRVSGADNLASAYKIDKIIWLLCTGEFYLDECRTGREAILRKIDLLQQ